MRLGGVLLVHAGIDIDMDGSTGARDALQWISLLPKITFGNACSCSYEASRVNGYGCAHFAHVPGTDVHILPDALTCAHCKCR